MYLRKYLDEIEYRVDYIIGIFGLVGGIIIMSLYLISPTVFLFSLGLTLFSASLLYFIFYNKNYTTDVPFEFRIYKSNKYLLEATFLILFTISIMTFHASENRTIFYFILISLCTGIVALLCIGVMKRVDVFLQIANIILISMNLKLTKFYFFGGSGVDYWGHLKMNNELSQFGNIEVLIGKEQFFPIMHINVAATQIVADLSGKDASMFSITIPLIISSIFAYLIGRELCSENVGLLAMLIVNVSDYHNWWGVAPQTTSYGIIIFFILIYALYKLKVHCRKIEWMIIVFMLMYTIIMSHAVSSFILLMTLIGLMIGSLIYSTVFPGKGNFITPGLILIYFVALIQQWFVADYAEGGNSFFDQISISLISYITGYSGFLNRPEVILEVEGIMPPFIERFVNTIGLDLLLLFSIIGTIYWLSSDFRSEETFSIVVCITLLLGITFLFPLLGLRNIIPHRWFAFEYLFLSIMASFAVIHIIRNMSKYRQICIIFVIFACLSFFMATSTSDNLTNLDSPLWLKEYSISTTYTFQEIKGAETISRYSNNAFSDSRYGNSILGIYCELQHDPLDSRDLTNRVGDVFIWRTYMEDRPIRMFASFQEYYREIVINVVLGIGFKEELQKMHKIYENDSVCGYYIRA